MEVIKAEKMVEVMEAEKMVEVMEAEKMVEVMEAEKMVEVVLYKSDGDRDYNTLEPLNNGHVWDPLFSCHFVPCPLKL